MTVEHAPRGAGLRHLVLAGSGPGHLWLLARLAHERPADLNISLVASASLAMPARLLADWVAGVHALQDCCPVPQALAQACHARVLGSPCVSLHADQRRLVLADGTELPFDWLSLDTEAYMSRARIEALMPGARAHALFAHPVAQFAQLWPQVLAMAAQRPIHVALVGGACRGLELAMALAHALRAAPCVPGSRLSWVTPQGLAELLPAPAPRRWVERRLRGLDITLLQAGCSGFDASTVLLDNGARLVCDAPILAGPSALPDWLADSDLVLDREARVAVDALGRSTSHPQVLAVNDVVAATPPGWGTASPERSGHRLLAALRDDWRRAEGRRPSWRWPSPAPLRLLTCGPRQVLAGWRGLTLGSRLLARLRQHWDRRFLLSLQATHPPRSAP